MVKSMNPAALRNLWASFRRRDHTSNILLQYMADRDRTPNQPQDQRPTGYQDRNEEQETSTSGSSPGSRSDWLQLGLGPPGQPSTAVGSTSSTSPSELLRLRPPLSRPLITTQAPFQRHIIALSPAGTSTSTPSVTRFVLPTQPRPPSSTSPGLWLILRAERNQREPFLQQIPRSYLRVRDGRVTIRLVRRYLANRLGLENDSEIELTCRGQQLGPELPLQQVRDSIWCARPDHQATITSPPSTEHIMTLHYARSS